MVEYGLLLSFIVALVLAVVTSPAEHLADYLVRPAAAQPRSHVGDDPVRCLHCCGRTGLSGCVGVGPSTPCRRVRCE